MPMTDEQCVTGAYIIKCLVSCKVYVGGAYESFKERWAAHRRALRRGNHYNTHLQAAWNQYGESEFIFEILERCQPVKKVIIVCEQKWLDQLNAYVDGYNRCPTAGSSRGRECREETKAKMSTSRRKVLTSGETQKNHSKLMKALWQDPNYRVKNVGRECKEETRVRMSLSRIGRITSEETKEKQRQSQQDPCFRAEQSKKLKKAWEDRRSKKREKGKRIREILEANAPLYRKIEL